MVPQSQPAQVDDPEHRVRQKESQSGECQTKEWEDLELT